MDELQQINEQIQTTSRFFVETTSHTSKVAEQVRDKSDASKKMAQKLLRLNEETSLLAVNALESLESGEEPASNETQMSRGK